MGLHIDDLLQSARRFDQRALGEDLYSGKLYAYAMRLLGSQEMAEECVSETFSRFLRALKNGGGPRQYLQAYLYRVTHNWITDTYCQRAGIRCRAAPATALAT